MPEGGKHRAALLRNQDSHVCKTQTASSAPNAGGGTGKMRRAATPPATTKGAAHRLVPGCRRLKYALPTEPMTCRMSTWKRPPAPPPAPPATAHIFEGGQQPSSCPYLTDGGSEIETGQTHEEAVGRAPEKAGPEQQHVRRKGQQYWASGRGGSGGKARGRAAGF